MHCTYQICHGRCLVELYDIKRGCASIALNCHTYNTRIVPVFCYVSQLVPLPSTFHELFGMCSAIRAPNALRESDYYQLHKIAGPKFRSISASCAAALFRTSLVTVTCWPRWIQQLEECAKTMSYLCSVQQRCHLSPPLGH